MTESLKERRTAIADLRPPENAASDARIIADSLHDPAAFTAVFERHFDAVHRYAQQRIGRAMADEIASETFLVAFDNRQSYRCDKANALPWLLGIATNLLRRHWRAERQQLAAYARVLEAQDHGRGYAAPPAGPQSGGMLGEALGALKREDRDALLMLVWADLSYQQIADALAVPIGTVRSRIARARRQMQRRIEPPAVINPGRTASCLTPAEETNDG